MKKKRDREKGRETEIDWRKGGVDDGENRRWWEEIEIIKGPLGGCQRMEEL